jgi:hypothetical protein
MAKAQQGERTDKHSGKFTWRHPDKIGAYVGVRRPAKKTPGQWCVGGESGPGVRLVVNRRKVEINLMPFGASALCKIAHSGDISRRWRRRRIGSRLVTRIIR